MDLITSTVSVSDESSSGDSTGPSTPICSPIVHPVLVKSDTDSILEPLLEFPKRLSLIAQDPPATYHAGCRHAPRSTVREICFIGAGYVGGPTAAVTALYNPNVRVNVVDRDAIRIKRWQSSHLPIHEPGLNSVVRVARDGAHVKTPRLDWGGRPEDGSYSASTLRRPNLFFTTAVAESIARSDMVFLAVNTSTKAFGQGAGRATDMSACDSAVREIAVHARPGTIIVEKSTVPCGTAKRISSILQSIRPGVPFEVLSNPEFLAEGSAIDDLQHPDRIIIGRSDTQSGREAAEQLSMLYTPWVPRSRILTSNTWSSELSKLVANAMLAQRISSINSISAICEETGADIGEIEKSIGSDARIGPKFLKAGLGYGGSCFRKDIASLVYLAESLGLDEVAEYWDQVNKMNRTQFQRFARKIIKSLDANLVGKKITILGFAFKANTGDTRESLSVEVIKELLTERPTEIAIFDPYCRQKDIERELERSCKVEGTTTLSVLSDPYQACSGADAIVIATDCDQFTNRSERVSPRHSISEMPLATPESTLHWAGATKHSHQDPSFVLTAPPPCLLGPHQCPECRHQITEKSPGRCQVGRIEWSSVIASMRAPRWIFDGRNVLDVEKIRELGMDIQIERIGRRLQP